MFSFAVAELQVVVLAVDVLPAALLILRPLTVHARASRFLFPAVYSHLTPS